MSAKRRITAYFVRHFTDGSIAFPFRRMLEVDGNLVRTIIDGEERGFFVPSAGTVFIYAIDSPHPLTSKSAQLTSKDLHAIFNNQCLRSFMEEAHKTSIVQRILARILIHKNDPLILPMGPALEMLEQQGNVEGDYIIFSKKVWEKFKEGWK